MKFTDGYWPLREGVTAAHPVEPRHDHAHGVTLRAYGPPPGGRVTVPAGDVAFTVVREGGRPRASCDDPAAPWALPAGERIVRAPAGTGVLTLEPA
ncbi:hypothetical protein ACWC10_19690 [Streptomyces sp. NPDC001595]|uniref:hypothetical protein n=1 Tax=Streptomyces sp. NPDC001532 TaxID=3154520 RepID=UPI0033173905